MKIFKFFVAAAGLMLVTACGNGGGNKPTPTPNKFTVTFDYNYEGSPEALVVEVDKGEKVEKPADPAARDGFKFMGWYKSKTSTDEAFAFDFDQEIYQDYKVYAGWGEFTLQHWCVVGNFQSWDITNAPEMTTEDYETYTYTMNASAGTIFKLAKDHDWEVQAVYEQLDLENSDVEELGITENEHAEDHHNIAIANAAQIKIEYNPFDQVMKVTKVGELNIKVTGYSVHWKGDFGGWVSESLSPTEPQLTGKWTTSKTTIKAGEGFGFTLDTFYDDGSSKLDDWFAADKVKFNDAHIDDAGGNYKAVDSGDYVLGISIDADGVITGSVESFEASSVTVTGYEFWIAGSANGWGPSDDYKLTKSGSEDVWEIELTLTEDEEFKLIHVESYSDGTKSATKWNDTDPEAVCTGVTIENGNYHCGTAGSYTFRVELKEGKISQSISQVIDN